MKKQIIFIISLVLLMGIVSSSAPSIPHAFKGTAKYTNGQNIPDGYIVTAKLDSQSISTSSVIKDGKYGYDDPLLVSDIIGNGEKVSFYINGKLVENDIVDFAIGEITNLDIIIDTVPFDNDNPDDGAGDDNSGSTGDSNGGGGGSSYVCVENWECGNWSECINDVQRRLCVDLNECGPENNKPEEYFECGEENIENTILDFSSTEPDEDDESFFSVMTGAVVGAVGTTGGVVTGMIILVILSGFVAIRIRKK